MKKNKSKNGLKIFVFFYVFMGLFVAYIGGITRETIEKIGTQKVTDKVNEIKRAYRTKDNDLYICYSGRRGIEQNIENWIVIREEVINIENGGYVKIKPNNSYSQNCKNSLFKEDKGLFKVGFNIIDENVFEDYFNILNPKYSRKSEKIYLTKSFDYFRFGYVKNDVTDNNVIALEIFTPDIEIAGDKTQLLFLPFALAIDIIAWPYRLNRMLNSSHM